MDIKSNRGLTLISLVLTVIVILIITAAMIYNTKNQIQMKSVHNLSNDIEILNAKVDDYYLKYGELPKLSNYTYPNNDKGIIDPISRGDFYNILSTNADARDSKLNTDLNPKDGDEYIVIDLEKLDKVTLTYGYDTEYRHVKETGEVVASQDDPVETEVYVINTKSHQIYFPHGIFVDNIMYYTF